MSCLRGAECERAAGGEALRCCCLLGGGGRAGEWGGDRLADLHRGRMGWFKV